MHNSSLAVARMVSLATVGLGLAAAVWSCGRSELGLDDTLLLHQDAGGDTRLDAHDAKSDVKQDANLDAKPDLPQDVKQDPLQDAAYDVKQDAAHDVKQDVPHDVKPDGPPKPCTTAADCEDWNNCSLDECVAGQCSYTWIDSDQDGHWPYSCGGDDCNDLNPSVYPGHPEACSDGVDNDCNGLTDCQDPSCAGIPNCGCVPDPGGEKCGNGKDDDCNGLIDCQDPKCAGTPGCGCTDSESGKCDNGIDDDCDGLIDCDDFDCFYETVCTCKNHPEICDNGVDDNCDLRVDCADPQCTGFAACICVPPGQPEVCDDKQDNDCDGFVDCADPDCVYSAACATCLPEQCSDGIDNDCNNLIDCADPACVHDPACKPKPEICNNWLDDDNDGLIDCEDPDCKDNPYCVVEQSNCQTAKLIASSGTYTGDTTGHKSYTQGSCGGGAGEAVFYFVLTAPTKVHFDTVGTSFDSTLYLRRGSCEDGQQIACDDDSGGAWAALIEIPILYPGTYFLFVDGFTVDPVEGPNQGPFTLQVQLVPNPPEICNNGIDDDGDHYVDCADSDCTNVGTCFHCNSGMPPAPEFGPSACTDGLDNDCDGKADCADSDCNASDYYKAECCNGADDNGNQIVDEFSCRCANDGECGYGQICYTHTAFACGPTCDQFYGNICPFVAPGSYCSTVTGQCEFP